MSYKQRERERKPQQAFNEIKEGTATLAEVARRWGIGLSAVKTYFRLRGFDVAPYQSRRQPTEKPDEDAPTIKLRWWHCRNGFVCAPNTEPKRKGWERSKEQSAVETLGADWVKEMKREAWKTGKPVPRWA